MADLWLLICFILGLSGSWGGVVHTGCGTGFWQVIGLGFGGNIVNLGGSGIVELKGSR